MCISMRSRSGSELLATERILVVSGASSKVSGARIDGKRLVSFVLPEPGGPIMRILWLPACGNFESARGGLLTAHIFEVEGEVLQLAEKLFSL